MELDVRGGTQENGDYYLPPRPMRRHPASLPLLAAITLLTVLLALAGEGAVLAWIPVLSAPGL
jgi:hypothetical protein